MKYSSFRAFKNWGQKQRGSSIMPYGLMVGLVAVIALVSVARLGTSVKQLFGQTGDSLVQVVDPSAPSFSPELSAPATQTISQASIPGACVAVSFTNNGSSAATGFSAPVVTGDYAITGCPATDCTGSLGSTLSCIISVRGTATSSGPISGNLSLTAAEGGTASVALSGVLTLVEALAWGHNSYGQIGVNTTTTSENLANNVHGIGNIGNLIGVTEVEGGFYHSCALHADNTVTCWGRNNHMQLGDNTSTDRSVPAQVLGVGGVGLLSNVASLSSYYYHNCVLTTSGTAQCWGRNDQGYLGDNSVATSGTPVEVVGVGGIGILSSLVEVEVGGHHSCARDTGGNIYCWGLNHHGQLGDNTTTERHVPTQVLGIGAIGTLSGIASFGLGEFHSCALTDTGEALCWGYNLHGYLGDNTLTERHTPVQVLGVGAVGVLSGLSVVSGGDRGSCAIGLGGSALCWGEGSSGNNGDGTTTERLTPVQVHGIGNIGMISGLDDISYGSYHVCARGTGGAAYCWGENHNGRLGDNTTTDRTSPIEVLEIDGVTPVIGITDISAGNAHNTAIR